MKNIFRMKKTIKILFVISFFSVRIFAQTGNDQPVATDSNGSPLQFTFHDNIYDFGGIEKYATASYKFQFKNSGSTPLVIADIHSSPNYAKGPEYKLQINWPKKPIKPGKKAVVTVTFISVADIGSFENDIYITSNATTPNYRLLKISGAVTPFVEKMKEPTPDLSGYFEFLGPAIKANTK